VFGRLAGYEDVNDADRLSHDPAMRWVVGGRATAGVAASATQMCRFETHVLAQNGNLTTLADLSGRWIDVVRARHPAKVVVLDMDSSVSPVFGEQEGSAYNGHFACTCYHLLFLFNQFGDLERCALRPGNVASADDRCSVLGARCSVLGARCSVLGARCSNRSAQVKRGVKLVGDTDPLLSSIAKRVAEVDLLMSEMAQSGQEQATALNQVNSAVNQMDQVTQRNAAMVEEATAAAANLKREADAMSDQIGHFSIGAGLSA
jgi:hypothetical protein